MSHDFLKELKDRHVLRVAGFYLLMSVPIMEAGDIVLPRLGLPDWSLTAVLWLLALGFPIALIIAWSYELTPDGVKSEAELRRTNTERRSPGRTVDFVVIALLVAAVAYLGVDKLSTDASPVVAAPGTPSIAVLPFVNMSDDESNEYFSDGVSEELLNALAKIPQLRVAARTSSFFYKGRNEDLREIGRNLGVATVIEGSVRKDGDRVRVTAQLINVQDGFHLWSDTYDYELDNVFAVQDRIARSVVDVLQVQLLGDASETISSRPTTSTKAHTAYLRGRYELHRRTETSISRSTTFFRDATDADPNYAQAWVGLAESLILQFVNHQSLGREEAMSGAEAALDRALALNDQLAEAYAALGLLRMQSPDKAGASEAYERALQIDPNYSEAWHWYGLLVGDQGDRAGAVAKLTTAVELDPLHRVARINLGQAILANGDLEGARAFFREGIELEPDYPVNYIVLANITSHTPWPRPLAAMELVDQALKHSADSIEALALKARLALELDNVAMAQNVVSQMNALNPLAANTVGARAGVLMYQSDVDAITTYIDQSMAQVSANLGNDAHMYQAVVEMYRGNYAEAVDAWRIACPELFDVTPTLPKKMGELAGLIAYTLRGAGHDLQADRVLDLLERRINNSARFGPMGYRLADVELAALRGEPQVALEHLRDALSQGYRNRLIHNAWTLDNYPLFDALRDDSNFSDMITTLDDYREHDDAR